MKKNIVLILGILFVIVTTGACADNNFKITGKKGYLVGGAGDTGNSFRYDGSEIWEGSGEAVIDVNEENNTGTVTGSVTTHGHTYKIVMTGFEGGKPFMSGGIARNLYLHGTTGRGPPVLPKVWTFLGGWGHADVYEDGKILYKDDHSHFMLTHATRDKTTHKVNYPGPKKLMMAKKSGDKAKVAAAKKEIEEAAKAVDTNTMQLHIVSHPVKKNPKNFPPFETFIHFMWDEITCNICRGP
jgi:hypothetical protein